VVVAFSRRAVIGFAGELNQLHPGRVACLYGAMPLASRREEIDRFVDGRAEVCAATDVLGHGVNLPCETLLFAETTKFDGRERRDLEPWEIAQIAGRAGRFGFHERGHVGVLTGLPWADPDPSSSEGLSSRTSRSRTATSATASWTAAACARSSPTST
jgi:ATP-dependent RNA helicase SUPV3L1/SUV3